MEESLNQDGRFITQRNQLN